MNPDEIAIARIALALAVAAVDLLDAGEAGERELRLARDALGIAARYFLALSEGED